MTINLYELAGAEPERRFSPFCWRIRMALRHKGCDFVTMPWHFTDKAAIAFSGQDKVPVLVDGQTVIHDSWSIAEYLDSRYPDGPSLFGPSVPLHRFATFWVEKVVQPAIFPLVALDILAHLPEVDRAYFRQSRESRIGQSLEDFAAESGRHLQRLQDGLAPARATLAVQPFLAGATPAWADFVLFGAFQWARCISPKSLLSPEDPVYVWRERMLDLFGGEGRAACGYPV